MEVATADQHLTVSATFTKSSECALLHRSIYGGASNWLAVACYWRKLSCKGKDLSLSSRYQGQ